MATDTMVFETATGFAYLKHRPGAMHLVPDALSRMPQAQAVYLVWSCFIYNKSTHAQTDIHHAIPLHPDSIEDVMGPLRQEDPELKTIMKYLKSGILPDDPVEARRGCVRGQGLTTIADIDRYISSCRQATRVRQGTVEC